MQGNFSNIVAEEAASGRTLLCVCPNSELVVRSALSVFQKYDAPLLFVATLNQVDSDGGYTGWTPSAFNDLVSAEMESASIETPVFLCLDHGGPWKKRSHSSHDSHLECLRATEASITECIDAGYSSIHVDATGVHSDLQTRSDLDYQIELTMHLQAFAERHATSELSFEVGTRENGLGPNAEPLFKQFLEVYFEQSSSRRLRPASFCVGDVGTSTTPVPADPLRLQRLVSIAKAHGSDLKVHFADDLPNLSALPYAGVRAANIGPGISAIEYSALQELCNVAGVPRSTSSNLIQVVRSSLIDAGLWNKLVGPVDTDLSEPLAIQRLGYASRYVWTTPLVSEVRSALYDRVRDVLDPDHFIQLKLEEYLANYLVHFGYVSDQT